MKRILLVPLLVGCKPPETKYDLVDTPTPVPQEVGAPPGLVDRNPGDPDPEKVAKCVRGTGKTAEGKCEALRTRNVELVQQVQLPRGRFVMGDIPRSYDANVDREAPTPSWSGQPPRYAEAAGFWLDLHEVTRIAYAKCVEAGACTPAKCKGGENPVKDYSEDVARGVPQTCVTHAQAEAYCKHRDARLPTETEWEYAARGTDARIYPWGNELMDEYRTVLMPINGMVDSSYFGLKAMGANAQEWVADAFEVDAGLAGFVSGEFRRPDGPLLTAMREHKGSFVVKGGRTGARQPKRKPEAIIGFRCAADMDPSETALIVPELAARIPSVTGSSPRIFGGVAESVDRDEAASFCDVLSVEWDGAKLEEWRLPTLEDVQANVETFRGPGPFWLADGAATQHDGTGKKPLPEAPWTRENPKPTAPLAARCVHP